MASAQPLFPGVVPYTTGVVSPYTSTLVNPVVTSPLVANPVVYNYNLAPQVRPEYEVDAEKSTPEVLTKTAEEKKVNPIVYSTPYGLQPVVPVKYNVEVPARFVQKNGEIQKTTYTKREAEADPLLLASPYVAGTPYVSSAVSPLVSTYTRPIVSTAYTTPVVSTAYTTPLVNTYSNIAPAVYTAPLATPVAPAVAQPVADVKYTKPVVEENAKTVANDQITPFGYAMKGTYAAVNEGAEHYAKREAESDPALYYSAGYYPSVYSTPSVYSAASVYNRAFTTPYLTGRVSPYYKSVSPYTGLIL